MFCFRSLLVRRSLVPTIESRMTIYDKKANRIRREPGEIERNTKRDAVLQTRLGRLMYWRSRSHEALTVPEVHRSDFIEWDLRSELYAFGKRLGEDISEENLRIVFTDPSYVEAEKRRRREMGIKDAAVLVQSNRQLASVGQSAMSSFIPKYLRCFLPRLPEEGISALQHYLLHDSNLAQMSRFLGTYDIILCEPKFPSESVLAQTLRAVVGAITKEEKSVTKEDGSVTKENVGKRAERFIIDFILSYLQDKHIFELWEIEDGKRALSRILRNEGLPDYESRLIRSTAMHTIESCFQVGLFVNKHLFGSGTGESVEIAEEMAAFDCLARLFHIRPSDFLFKFGPKSYGLNYDAHSNSHQPFHLWSSREL